MAAPGSIPKTALDSGSPLHKENREMAKRNFLSGKTQIIWKFGQNTGNVFAQVVNSLILQVKDIVIFAVKISIFSKKLDMSAKLVLCM